MNISSIVILTIVEIILLIVLIVEIRTFFTLKDVFTCKHCGTINDKISNNHKCIKCNRRMTLVNKSWEYFFLHRIHWISNNKNSYTEYKYKDYTKLPKIELTVISICLIIVGVSIITFI